MRAVQIAILLLCLNAGFFIVQSGDIWESDQMPEGKTPQQVRDKLENGDYNQDDIDDNVEGMDTGLDTSLPLPSPLRNILNSNLGLGVLLAGVLVGSFSTRLAKVTSRQAVGIIFFAIMYSLLLGHTAGVLEAMMVPGSIITIITGFNFFWLTAGVIQMATGQSFEVLQ